MGLKSFIQRLLGLTPFSDALKIETLEEFCAACRKQVELRSLDDGLLRDAEDVWKSGWGNCRDFAVMVVAWCARNHTSHVVWRLYNRDYSKGHSIVTGRVLGDGTVTWWASNGFYRNKPGGIQARAVIDSYAGLLETVPANITAIPMMEATWPHLSNS